MHVEDVEVIVLHHIDQTARQGCLVRGELEQGVVLEGDLVKTDVGQEGIEAGRTAVRHEVHLMTFLGQGLAQLGGDHTTSTVGGITDHADVHTALIEVGRKRPLPPEGS